MLGFSYPVNAELLEVYTSGLCAGGQVFSRHQTESFSGTFTAIPEYSPLTFDYSYNLSTNVTPCYDDGYIQNRAWLTVIDLTDNKTLYNDYFLNSYMYADENGFYDTTHGADSISVSTIENHQIYIDFGVETSVTFPHFSHGTNLALTYTITPGITIVPSTYTPPPVVPEPISYILFITGGALLAGKRYLRWKA